MKVMNVNIMKNIRMEKLKKLLYLLPLIAVLFTFSACEDDEAEHGLTANAGADREVSVGATVTLDASGSTDMNGAGFSSNWIFVNRPDASSASISNADAAIATFVPDVMGEYLVQLTISNDLGESTDEVMVTAIAAGTMSLGGSYNDDLHLINLIDDPDVADYMVTSDIDIYADLIIDPGVRIHVGSDKRIRVRSSGTLQANGTSDEPIIVTGETEVPGFWRGIMHESNNVVNVLNHVHISAAGSSDMASGRPKTAFYVASGRINLQNSVFTGNDGLGVTVWSGDAQVPMVSNYFENNATGAMSILAQHIDDIDGLSDFNGQEIYVRGGSIAGGSEHQWPNPLNGSYRVSSDIESYGKIIIEEGAVFKFENDIRFRLRSDGVMQAMGTESNPVVFKGAVEMAGAWRGLLFESNSLENQLHHMHFLHAGHSGLASGYGKTAIGFASGSRATLSNVQFYDIDGYGIYIRYENAEISFDKLKFGQTLAEEAIYMRATQIASLDHESDFGNNYVVVDGGTLNKGSDHNWIKLQNGKYLFTGDPDIYDKITIEAGAVFEFDNDVRFRLRTESTIIAEGTASDMIVFSRRQGAGAYWKGLYYQSNSPESVMNYVEISYAGNSNLAAGLGQTNLGVDNNSRLTLTNSTISNSLGWGIDVRSSGDLTESNNTFFGNAMGDINYQ
jgi:hypothetical protein